MKKNLTELVFILDSSGSMCGLESDTIGGFNSMLAKQKKQEGEAYVSTLLFDTEEKILHDRLPLKEVRPLTDRDYRVGGCTALLDAIGHAVKHIQTIHKYIREEDRPEKTMFVITTDGMENASKEYTYERVKELVEKQQKAGWEFLFLGANIDAIAEAGKMGIRADRAVNYNCDEMGTALNYDVVAEAVCAYRAQPSCARESALDRGEGWKARIERDFKNRKRKPI